jgi:hypothetical protein
MGEVVELWSVGSFRAMFLIEEWQRLAESLKDYDRAARAHRSLCRDWEQIWDVEAADSIEEKEDRLRQLSDAAIHGFTASACPHAAKPCDARLP